MKCERCGAEMDQTEKDTSSGRDIREYKCFKCGHSDWEDRGKALWEILHEDEQERVEAERAKLATATASGSHAEPANSTASGNTVHPRSAGKILHRGFSAILGLVLVLAGLVVSGYIETNFKGDTLISGAVGVLVPGVLMLSAFYMAYLFLKFAATGRK